MVEITVRRCKIALGVAVLTSALLAVVSISLLNPPNFWAALFWLGVWMLIPFAVGVGGFVADRKQIVCLLTRLSAYCVLCYAAMLFPIFQNRESAGEGPGGIDFFFPIVPAALIIFLLSECLLLFFIWFSRTATRRLAERRGRRRVE